MNPLIRVVSLVVPGFLISGCMTALYLADRPSEAVLSEMRRLCAEDSGVRWLGPALKDVDLWLPGRLMRDPADDPDFSTAEPYRDFGYGDEAWLRNGARALYVRMAPGSSGYHFGPTSGQDGWFRLEMLPDDDARCAPYHDWLARNAARGIHRPTELADRCLAYSYAGAALRPGGAVFVRFDDEPLKARGLYRSGQRLLVDGQTRASFTEYWAINPESAAERRGQWGIEACKLDPRGAIDLLPPLAS